MARPKRSAQIVDLQGAIKDNAWKQIAEYGAPGLSLRGVARALKITAPAIYHYFPSHNHLVTALVADAFTSFAEALEIARDACAPDDHAGRFRAISLAYRQWGVSHPQRYMLIFGTSIPDYEESEESSAAGQRSFMVLVGVLGEAQRAGKIRLPGGYISWTPALQEHLQAVCNVVVPYEPVVLYLALEAWSKIHGLTSLELYGHLANFMGTTVEDFIQTEVNGYMKVLGLG